MQVKVLKKLKTVSLNSFPVATAVKVACKAQNPFGHNINEYFLTDIRASLKFHIGACA